MFTGPAFDSSKFVLIITATKCHVLKLIKLTYSKKISRRKVAGQGNPSQLGSKFVIFPNLFTIRQS